jgi:hypothetical protein
MLGTRFVLSAIAAASLLASDSPFVGNWRLNPQKGTDASTFTVTLKGQDRYIIDVGAVVWDLNANGKPGPGPKPLGGTATFTQVNSSTWTLAYDRTKRNLHLKDKDTLEAVDVETVKGGELKSITNYQRVGTSSGLAGTSFAFDEDQLNANMTFDEIEYPVTGKALPENIKLSGKAKLVDNNTIIENITANGKEMTKMEYKLSPDGKTLTVLISGPKVRQKQVYERE